MSDIPKFIYQRELRKIAAGSFRNCHARGVDSILFDDTPGARLRAFVCLPKHELWRNAVPLCADMSVGLHPHHCDIKLLPYLGRAYNVTSKRGGSWCDLSAFRYDSAITGQGSFELTAASRRFPLVAELIEAPVPMPASRIHTIYVPQGERAAWFVHEGAEWKDYQPLTYSNVDLREFDWRGMYAPMNVRVLRAHLEYMGIEIRSLADSGERRGDGEA